MLYPSARALFCDRFADAWRPDETLFSLASRQHVLSCNVHAADTCVALFGHARHGSAHDLPSRIDAFVDRTRGVLGDAETIIRERTMLPFYLPHRSNRDARNAIAAMRGDSIGPLKGQLGMLAGRFRAHHPLKACPECITIDQSAAGAAYWRVQHQLPGALVCLIHGVPLLHSPFKSSGVGRFHWHLPHVRTMQPAVADFKALRDSCIRVAGCACRTWSLPSGFHFEGAHLTATYRRAAAERGIVSNGRIDTERLARSLLAVTGPLSAIPELAAFPTDAKGAASQFARFLHQPRTIGHPLRHFALILALFGTWDAFWLSYEEEIKRLGTHERLPADLVEEEQISRSDPRREAARVMFAAGASARSVASSLHVSTGTAMAWAAQCAVALRRRPKRLKPDLRRLVIKALNRGAAKQAVAQAFGVSMQTVTTTLRTEIGLADRWNEARFATGRRRARKAWCDAAQQDAMASATEIRRFIPAAFAWLYRNDRAWLREQIRQRPAPARSNHRHVDWDERDRQFAQKVLEVALELVNETGRARITIGRLCQHIPELKPALSKIQRLPLTAASLRQVTHCKNAATDQALL